MIDLFSIEILRKKKGKMPSKEAWFLQVLIVTGKVFMISVSLQNLIVWSIWIVYSLFWRQDLWHKFWWRCDESPPPPWENWDFLELKSWIENGLSKKVFKFLHLTPLHHLISIAVVTGTSYFSRSFDVSFYVVTHRSPPSPGLEYHAPPYPPRIGPVHKLFPS